jgi:hypothetical protein
MKKQTVAGLALVALCASTAYAGDPLIDLTVSIGGLQTATDVSGGFTISKLKAGKYDVVLTGNPVKSYLDADGGRRISLTINGKRFPLVCSPTGCVAKAVPISGSANGSVRLAN